MRAGPSTILTEINDWNELRSAASMRLDLLPAGDSQRNNGGLFMQTVTLETRGLFVSLRRVCGQRRLMPIVTPRARTAVLAASASAAWRPTERA